MSEVMNIHATTVGMGGASTGIMGTTSLGDQSVHQLKKAVVAFADALQKDSGSEATLALRQEVEGHLLSLQAVSVITNERCEQLITDLHNLTESGAAQD